MFLFVVPDFVWPYLALYIKLLAVLILVSSVTTLLQIRCGRLLQAYIWCLQKTMEWSVSYVEVWEEENKMTEQQSKAQIRSGNIAKQESHLLHRDAINKLRSKLRQRSNSAREPSVGSGSSGSDSNQQLQRTRLQTPEAAEDDMSCLQLVTEDTFDFIKAGMECICEDEYNHAMEAQELPSWNMLSRSKSMYPVTSLRIKLIWAVGFVCRYFILLPVRVWLFFQALLLLVALVTFIKFWPEHGFDHPRLKGVKRADVCDYGSLVVFRMIGKSISLYVRYLNTENRPQTTGMVVANHTAPLDVLILCTEQTHALTGQKHPGMLGFMEQAAQRITPHLWFDRTSQHDRANVVRAMREHIKDPANPPMLIFPEGVCVNNTAVVQFKKGAFEVAETVYPVAIQYDAKYCDPFWYQDTWLGHLKDLWTSWAVVCECVFLPPMTRQQGQTAIAFADEVKAKICEASGLRFLSWDGYLKMYTVKQEQKDNEKREYSEYLKESMANMEGARQRRHTGNNNGEASSSSLEKKANDTNGHVTFE